VGLLELKDLKNVTYIKDKNRYFIRIHTESINEKSVIETEIINEDEKYFIKNLKLNIIYLGIKDELKISLIQNENEIKLFIVRCKNKNIRTIKIDKTCNETKHIEFENDTAVVYFLKNIKEYVKRLAIDSLAEIKDKRKEKTKNEIFTIISQL